MDKKFLTIHTNQHCLQKQNFTNIGDHKNKMLHTENFSSVIPQENNHYTITKGDSTASSHYFASCDKSILKISN